MHSFSLEVMNSDHRQYIGSTFHFTFNFLYSDFATTHCVISPHQIVFYVQVYGLLPITCDSSNILSLWPILSTFLLSHQKAPSFQGYFGRPF